MYPYASVCYPYVVLVCTRMYLCVTRILPRVIPLCICVVLLVKILVNGYGHSEEIPVIVHNNPFTFLYKEEENRAGHFSRKEKWGYQLPTDKAKILKPSRDAFHCFSVLSVSSTSFRIFFLIYWFYRPIRSILITFSLWRKAWFVEYEDNKLMSLACGQAPLSVQSFFCGQHITTRPGSATPAVIIRSIISWSAF